MNDKNNEEFEIDGEVEAFEEVDDIITLYDEDGKGVDFQMLDMLSRGDDKYAVLYPLDEGEDDGSLVILKLTEGEEDDTLESIDDEELLAGLFEEFKELHKDEFTFEE
jgi:uncharacterized protein YrzB (UPF0473 family)